MLKHRRAIIFSLLSLVLLLSGCWLRPYKMNIVQGNRFVQSAVERVEPGMTREQVEFLLGAPVIADPFHEDRWDYLLLLQPGYGKPLRRLVSVYFSDEGLVTRIEGDVQSSAAMEEEEEAEIPESLPELPDEAS